MALLKPIELLCNSNFSFDIARHPENLLIGTRARFVIVGPADNMPLGWCIKGDEPCSYKVKDLVSVEEGMVQISLTHTSIKFEIYRHLSDLPGEPQQYERIPFEDWRSEWARLHQNHNP